MLAPQSPRRTAPASWRPGPAHHPGLDCELIAAVLAAVAAALRPASSVSASPVSASPVSTARRRRGPERQFTPLASWRGR